MKSTLPLTFKVATEAWEFELIHRLNHQTFVEEIPQHQPNPAGRLVDKFHPENAYLICLAGHELAGMMAFRARRPFSLDYKLPDLGSYLPPGRTICEVRLLAVDNRFRNKAVLPGLLSFMEKYASNRGCDAAVISGTTRQLRLYRRIGFKPFGPLVGPPSARFQPMVLLLEDFRARLAPILDRYRPPVPPVRHSNFLPGPVTVHASVRRAFTRTPLSHRSIMFKADLSRVRKMLCELTGATRAEILLGSGTLANEVIAAQLSLLNQRGLVLSNGEFGERLIDHATRWGLTFETVKAEWGTSLPLDIVCRHMTASQIGWLWAVHCETSTGVLNDIAALQEICGRKRIKLCLDCISSVGLVGVDLREVYLASGVSGKGVGGYPGLGLVFMDHEIEPAPDKLPRYLDVGFYAQHEGVPFTHSSNLLAALRTAVERLAHKTPYARRKQLTDWLRCELRRRGFRLLAPDEISTPGVVTLVFPDSVSTQQIGADLESAGFLLSYQSQYLRDRNWMQICLMGECRRSDLVKLVQDLGKSWPAPTLTSFPRRISPSATAVLQPG